MERTKYLSITTAILVLLLLSEINVYADIPANPIAVKGGLLLFIGIIVALIAVFAWLIIRSTKK